MPSNVAPPKNLMEVLQRIELEEHLGPNDARYVDTTTARGSEKTFTRLCRKFGWNGHGELYAPRKHHVLFFGHIGCGKSTELRRQIAELHGSAPFHTVVVDLLAMLDRNNLQYTEALLAMTEALLKSLQNENINVPPEAFEPVHEWFARVINTRALTRELTGSVESGGKIGGGIPGIIALFAKITASIKTGSDQREEWRTEIRARFTDLSDAFNGLVRATEEELKKIGKERVVFLVDGTDKLRGDDVDRFFVRDVSQVEQIEALVVYTAPLHMKYSGQISAPFDADLILPMVKLFDAEEVRFEPGWNAMRKLLVHRADRSVFASASEIDALVEASGGHPREMLRLLRLCCELGDQKIDADAVNAAKQKLASDYRRFLSADDFTLLVAVDRASTDTGNGPQTQKLLQQLALLEYNDGSWRRSHPVVRLLPGYKDAKAAART